MQRLLFNFLSLLLVCGCSREINVPGSMTDHGSGDVVPIVMACAARHGGFGPATVSLPTIKCKWSRLSVPGQDMITIKGDHVTEFQNLLIQAYGVPDPRGGSFRVMPGRVLGGGPNGGQIIGNTKFFHYGAEQCGVELTVNFDDKDTQVLIQTARKR